MNSQIWFAVYFAVGMMVGSLNARALGLLIPYATGLACLYPDWETAGILTALLIPAVLLASFRD